MTRLKFSPTKEFKTSFAVLAKVIENINFPKDFDLNQLANDLYADKIGMPTEILEGIVDYANNERQLEQLSETFIAFWNDTPRKSLGGLSPNAYATKNRRPTKETKSSDWHKIMDLLLSVQGNFQSEVYETLDQLDQKFRELIIKDVHRLFERYYYTVIKDLLPDQAAPADLVDDAIMTEQIKQPSDGQIQIRLFKSPAKHKDLHKKIRMQVGIETIQDFPIVQDLLARNKKSNLYPDDPWYNQCLAHLTKIKVNQADIGAVVFQLWLFSLDQWRKDNILVARAYTTQAWQQLWWQVFEGAKIDWQSTDEIFDQMLKKIHNEVLPMDATANLINAPKGRFIQPTDRLEELQYLGYFFLGSTFESTFLSPLVTYLPLIEMRYIEPINIGAEIRQFMGFKGRFSDSINKPPSYFKFREPLGTKLWSKAEAYARKNKLH